MTVNIEALIRSLRNSYQEIFDSGLIPYKTKPTGASGDPVICLDMAKEGVFLAFDRNGQKLKEVTIYIQRDIKGWSFPNILPSPLQKSMSRQWMHDVYGKPERSIEPRVVMRRTFGWVELFTVEGFHIPVSMQVNYDLMEMVMEVAFLPTSELRW